MKRIIQILIAWLILIEVAFPQNSIAYKYSNKELYKYKSVVFTESYKPKIKLPNNANLFTPTIDEIIQAEHILLDRYNIDIKKAGLKKVKNVKKKYYRYKRQYLGFIDSSGNKKIIINLLNFKCNRRENKNFLDWESEFLVGFGRYYEANSMRYVININSGLLNLSVFE